VPAVASHPAVVLAACAQLQRAGFEILNATSVSINFAGPAELFERAFRTRIVEKEVASVGGVTSTHLDSPDTDVLGLISTAGTPFAGVIEGVALEVPRVFFTESPIPPSAGYWHLRVPGDVAIASNASQVHPYGITGQGVRVAFVDSGHYSHAFFRAQGYNVAPVVLAPGAADPEHDESGHGTGESANVLAIAPGCELLPVKMSFVNTVAAFNTAVALRPDIITCSWGSNSPFELSAVDAVLAASVAAAVASGITVIFAAGNGHAGFPGQHPDVISAGGVFMDSDGSLQASDYSSAFSSEIYPGREVPDVCGLVGMRPKAMYIMLPVEGGDQIDVGNAGGAFPDGDETEPDDAWAAFSGTSAAAPQLAGIAALIKQVAPAITPVMVKALLMHTARDVVEGTSGAVSPFHVGLPAGPGPDEATGSGLVDAYSAVMAAYFAAATGFAGALEDPLTTAYLRGLTDAATFIGAYA
jgi:subtilisin family serine protease